MEVRRWIGRHEVLVDVTESCGISLEEATRQAIPGPNDATLSKKDILRALSSGDEYYPLSLHWELLDKCNFKCPFCYIVGHSFRQFVRFAEMQPHLSELVNEGLLFAVLTGGEVTLHPDFCEIYAFLKQRGVIVEVFTNGFTIDDRLFDIFTQYHPYVVEVSVYSVNDKRMREVYGASGDRPAEVVLNNVLRLKEMGLPVVCKTFLNTVTTQDFDEIVLWCDTNNVEHSSSSDLTPAYDGTDLSEFKIDGRESERLAILNEGQRNICFPCGTKNYGCAIMPAFEVCPCPSIMHRDCYFDLRQLGVRESLRRMVAFMRRFQDSEIVEATNGTARHKTCIAFSEPVRNDGGEILHFAKSRT